MRPGYIARSYHIVLWVSASALPTFVVNEGPAAKGSDDRMSAILVLVGVGILTLSATAVFVAVIIGIRRGDRRHLANTPQSHSDALARRILVGVRHPSNSADGENQ